MGGMNSNFTMGNGTNFEWQHDSRFVGSNQLSLFDNAATAWASDETSARGLLLEYDLTAMSVSLITEFLPFNRTVSESQGNLQILESGQAIVGWGQTPYFSQHASDGSLQWSVQFGIGDVQACKFTLIFYSAKNNVSPPTRPCIAVQLDCSTADDSFH